MNVSVTYNDLTEIEREIADLYVFGYTKKEIAAFRGRSIYTIVNQLDRIFKKIGVRKDTEMATWYYCTRFHISIDISPIKRTFISACMLVLLSTSMVFDQAPMLRTVRTRNITRTSQGRRSRNDYDYIDFEG